MAPVIANFFITRHIIKERIYEKNKKVNNPILYGLSVSSIVFIIRLLVGVLVFSFLL